MHIACTVARYNQGMSQRQQLRRLMEIDRRLRAGVYPNAASLQTVLEVKRRVIFNDIAYLRDQLRAPIAYCRQNKGWYYTEASFSLPNLHLPAGKVLALVLSVEAARHALPTPLGETLLRAIEQLAAHSQDTISLDWATLRAYYTFAQTEAPSVALDLLNDLQTCLRACHTLEMDYFTASRNTLSTRRVHPHHIFQQRSEWYLVAFDPQRGDIRHFNLGRVKGWRVLAERFTRQPGFEAQAYMATVFEAERGAATHTFEVRLDSAQVPYVRERNYPPGRTLEDLPDGGAVVRFTSAGWEAAKRWVLARGPHAEALAPPEFRAALAADLRAAAQLYAEVP